MLNYGLHLGREVYLQKRKKPVGRPPSPWRRMEAEPKRTHRIKSSREKGQDPGRAQILQRQESAKPES